MAAHRTPDDASLKESGIDQEFNVVGDFFLCFSRRDSTVLALQPKQLDCREVEIGDVLNRHARQVPYRDRISCSPRSAPLVLRRELASPTCLLHAEEVGVPAPRDIAFGGDERVLARRVQHAVAKRADIARGLQVLRGSHRPPAGFHRSDDTARPREAVGRETPLHCRICR